MTMFDLLNSLHLPAGASAIIGSGPLIVREIIPASNDLDIICRGSAWKTVQKIGEPAYLCEFDVAVVTMCGGHLTAGSEYAIGDFDINELIDSAEIIDGLPLDRMENEASYKKIAKRPKDLEHLKALEALENELDC